MPIATPQGTLDFKSVDKVTFVGASSNTVIDTTTGSLGVGVGVGGPTSNLHVVGNTRLEGDINMLHTANTASIKLNSNVVAEFPRSKKLIKYPRVALTADAETESGYNGYKVERSSVADSQYAAWKAFNNINGLPTGDYPWISENSPDGYTTATGLPTGNNGDVFQTVNGAWLSIELPHNIKLSYMMLSNRNDNSSGIRPPKDIVVWGSLDGTTWTSLKTYTNTNVSQAATYKVDINSTSYYKHFRLHILSVHATDAVAIGEWELYGTPEYDPEAHGTDVTVKSVANVPNTDWLEVYYDAKDLATGAVTNVDDLTPSGTNDGTATNVTVSDGAFVFNGSSYLETDIPQITTGVWPFTMSFWFKVNAHIGTTWNYLAHLGIRGTNGDSTLVGLRNDQISITTWGDSKINSGVVATPGVWYHVTSTWPGGAFYDNAKLYINAVSYGDVDNTRDEVNPLSFPTSGNKLTLGKQMNTTSDYFNGSIANFRLFNRALTQDEIYQLYAYQKEDFGHSTNNMTLKAGRLGIGTSEPRAALDVRGDIYRNGAPAFPIPVAAFYKLSASTSNTTHDENIQSGWVAFTGANTTTPGVIEAYTLSGGTTTQGTSSGVVVKLCKKGMYKLEAGFAINTQSGINSHIGIGIYPVSNSYIPGNTSRVHYTLGGAGSLAGYFYIPGATNNINQQFRMTEILRVSEGPGYAYVTMTPNSNNSTHFQFQNWASYPHGVMYVTYLG